MAGGGTDPAVLHARYETFAESCRAVGRNAADFDVCKMASVGVATDDASAKRMTEELMARTHATPEALAARTLVGTPDVIAARLRAITDVGINHHIFSVAESEQWPDYLDAVDLLRREVVPRVRD